VVALGEGAPSPSSIDASKTKLRGAASRKTPANHRTVDGLSVEEREVVAADAKSMKILSRFGLDQPAASVQVKLEDGWKNTTDKEFKQISDQLKGGLKKFTIQARGAMYLMDFTDPKNITQTNASTKKTRQLRIVGAHSGGA